MDQLDAAKLIPIQFVDQLDAVNQNRKTVNAELNQERELEQVQELGRELELAQEQGLDPHNNSQEQDLHLLQLPMVHLVHIQPTPIVHGVNTVRIQPILIVTGVHIVHLVHVRVELITQ